MTKAISLHRAKMSSDLRQRKAASTAVTGNAKPAVEKYVFIDSLHASTAASIAHRRVFVRPSTGNQQLIRTHRCTRANRCSFPRLSLTVSSHYRPSQRPSISGRNARVVMEVACRSTLAMRLSRFCKHHYHRPATMQTPASTLRASSACC